MRSDGRHSQNLCCCFCWIEHSDFSFSFRSCSSFFFFSFFCFAITSMKFVCQFSFTKVIFFPPYLSVRLHCYGMFRSLDPVNDFHFGMPSIFVRSSSHDCCQYKQTDSIFSFGSNRTKNASSFELAKWQWFWLCIHYF